MVLQTSLSGSAIPASVAEITARVVAARAIRPEDRRRLFDLFSRYYDDVTEERFADDLARKDEIVVVADAKNEVVGFSTLSLEEVEVDGRRIRVLFSGDTIVDRRHWGSQVFTRAWIRHIGKLWSEAPSTPLFWLLIVKGHRTFRYLPTFALHFVPTPRGGDDPDLVRLREELARRRFADAYDPVTGVVRFPERCGRLAPEWAEVEPHHARRDEVAFFHASNPGWREGDELVCLCPVAPENMRAHARRLFDEGARG